MHYVFCFVLCVWAKLPEMKKKLGVDDDDDDDDGAFRSDQCRSKPAAFGSRSCP